MPTNRWSSMVDKIRADLSVEYLEKRPRDELITTVRRLINLSGAIASDADRAQAEADRIAPVEAFVSGLLARKVYDSASEEADKLAARMAARKEGNGD